MNAWARLRLYILDRDHWTCHWCGCPATTADHVVPRIEGGPDHPSNLVAACRSCNSRRSIQWHNNHPHRTTSQHDNRWHTIRRRQRPTPPTGVLG